MQKLLDFDVVIESHADGYHTHVITSPARQAQADFTLPFTEKDLEILVLRVLASIGLASAIHDEANEPQITPLSCVDARKSAHEAPPVGCGPNEALPQLRGCL